MMAGRGTSQRNAAGGPARHIPVLLGPVLDALSPRDGGIYVDGTFGAGGYSRAILEAADCRVVAIDRDPAAVAAGQEMAAAYAGRLRLVLGRFSTLDEVAGTGNDGVALDVGVSSMQLDQAERGFSFMREGPLDMRMGGEGPSAADVVNSLPEAELARVIYIFGEERRSRAVARAICRARERGAIASTRQLAEIVAGAVGGSREQKHPATRTFQALRIYVNSELEELAAGLSAAERALKPGGRLAVVSFHSLEDRLVKRFLGDRSKRPGTSRHLPEATGGAEPTFRLLKGQPVKPDEAEVAANPRARSARLRGAERTGAPARPLEADALGLGGLPTLASVSGRLQ